jgi:hypothetical protein
MVPMSENDYVYVTEFVEGMDFSAPAVKTFDTQEEAEQAADFWRLPGKEELVKVVEYDPNAE